MSTQVQRRSVLKWIGIGAGTTVVAAGTGIGVRAAVNGGFAAGTGAPYDLWDAWPSLSGVDRVAAAGVLACNPHNTQPWSMALSPGAIDLYSDPARRMPVNDAFDREHFAGLGCAVENMVIAAGAAGFTPAQSRTDGDRFWVDATRDVHAATAAAYGVVTVPDVLDRKAQVAGGRLLVRLHLAATAIGLGLHHMNQVTERIDRDRATGRPDVFSARWSQGLGIPAALVALRIGHPEREPGRSPRRPLEETTR